MTATNQTEQTALTLPERAAVALGESANAAKLRELAAQSAGIVIINSADGREEAHRAAMVLRSTRTSITNTGKAAREDATAFSKAVIALEKDLIAIIEPEETRVLALRDDWDERIAAEKAAKIAAERARIDTIQACLQNLRDYPLQAAGKSSQEIGNMIGILVASKPDASYAEFIDQAKAARHEALEKLAKMETAQRAIEIEAESQRQEAARQAAAAEEARKAEAARIEAERAELAQLRAAAAETARLAKIETDRIAAEQAAEAQRLAEQEAELQRQRDAEAARVRAEQEVRDRIAAETKRQLDEQQAAIAAERAAFAREQVEARAHVEAAAQLERDHAEALPMNAQFDIDREAERARLQAIADQAATDRREQAEAERACSMPAGSLAPVEAERPDVDEVIGQLSVIYDLTGEQVIDMLEGFDLTTARLRHEVAK